MHTHKREIRSGTVPAEDHDGDWQDWQDLQDLQDL
jgi:hypothetical protein